MKPNITDDLLKQLQVSCSSETQLSTLVPNFERPQSKCKMSCASINRCPQQKYEMQVGAPPPPSCAPVKLNLCSFLRIQEQNELNQMGSYCCAQDLIIFFIDFMQLQCPGLARFSLDHVYFDKKVGDLLIDKLPSNIYIKNNLIHIILSSL